MLPKHTPTVKHGFLTPLSHFFGDNLSHFFKKPCKTGVKLFFSGVQNWARLFRKYNLLAVDGVFVLVLHWFRREDTPKSRKKRRWRHRFCGLSRFAPQSESRALTSAWRNDRRVKIGSHPAFFPSFIRRRKRHSQLNAGTPNLFQLENHLKTAL